MLNSSTLNEISSKGQIPSVGVPKELSTNMNKNMSSQNRLSTDKLNNDSIVDKFPTINVENYNVTEKNVLGNQKEISSKKDNESDSNTQATIESVDSSSISITSEPKIIESEIKLSSSKDVLRISDSTLRGVSSSDVITVKTSEVNNNNLEEEMDFETDRTPLGMFAVLHFT